MPALDIIQVRRGTAAAWASANPTLDAGEPGLETDGVLKVGDGVTAFADLPYWMQPIKKPVLYTDLQTAGLTKTFKIFTLPKRGGIHIVEAEVTTAFAGTGIVTLVLTVGDAGNNSRYLASFSLLSTGVQTPYTTYYDPSHSATTDINVYATAVGANLSNLSQGALSIWLHTSKLQ